MCIRDRVVSGETTFEEILKLIDLEDDLGTNTNLGLEETIKDSEKMCIRDRCYGFITWCKKEFGTCALKC